MDREEFKKKMKNHTVMTDDMRSNIQALHLKNTKKSEIYIVAMEELSELQKEISKELRGQGDRDGILEELADVMIVCGNIMNLQKITDAELRAATAIKLDRILSKLVEKENGNESKCKVGSDCPHNGIGCGSCGNSSRYGEVHHESREYTGWTPD
nr:MAG TPA: nucleoside triphosphate pyrophosphohydrolase [Caudoviricetes sp.]